MAKSDSFRPPVCRHPADRRRVVCVVDGESLTHQSHKAATEISNIIRKYDNTGLMPDGRPAGSYADCTAFQFRSRAELIEENRQHMRELESSDKKRQAAAKAAADKQREADAAELKRLQEAEKASKSSATKGGDQPPASA